MGCRSDYMAPTTREKELQATTRLYAFCLSEQSKLVPKNVLDAISNIYCNLDCVASLCAEIRAMDEATLNKVVYNARNQDSRNLANWWERHQEADRLNEANISAEIQQQVLKKSAKAKLSPEEREALGIGDNQ